MIATLVSLINAFVSTATLTRSVFRDKKNDAAAVFDPAALIKLRGELKNLRGTVTVLAAGSSPRNAFRLPDDNPLIRFYDEMYEVLQSLKALNLNALDIYYPGLGSVVDDLYQGDSAVYLELERFRRKKPKISNRSNATKKQIKLALYGYASNRAFGRFNDSSSAFSPPEREPLSSVVISEGDKKTIDLVTDVMKAHVQTVHVESPKRPSASLRSQFTQLGDAIDAVTRTLDSVIKENWTVKDLSVSKK